MLKEQKVLATKAFHAALGAPFVAGRKAREYGSKVADYSNKWAEDLQEQYDEFANEGEKVAAKMRDRNMVEELQSRVDLEKVQDRVEKLRDQLEGALSSWRESFTPEQPAKAEPVEKPATKQAPAKTTAKKAPAKKATAKKAPATKATAKKAPATKTPATKAPAKKAPAKTTARKAPAKKAPAKTTAKAAATK